MDLLHSCVALLNHEPIKEGIKCVAGSVTFAFGIVEIYDIYRSRSHQEIYGQNPSLKPIWRQIANKIILISAKLSLILSALVSRQGVWMISSLIGWVATPIQLEHLFGHNTTFAQNPYHPRHLISIAAVIFTLPSLFSSKDEATSPRIRSMAFFNTLTSRPTLHLGNQLISKAT